MMRSASLMNHKGGGGSLNCEVMGFCLKLATWKKRRGLYPFCAQLKFSKMCRRGLPGMCRSVYLSIFGASARNLGGILPQK